jgi:hypothetical protein
MIEKTQRESFVGAQHAAPLPAHSLLPLSAFALMLFILLLSTAVRFHNLGAQSLWNDEGISFVQSTRTLPDIISNSARDIHPPLYYVLLAGWRVLVGESEFALRALSALFSLITVAFAYALGKRLYGYIAGIAAALFVALNTFSIYYAQELRMYSLLTLIAAASMWVFVGMIVQNRRESKSPLHVMGRGLLNPVQPGQTFGLTRGWGLALLNAAGLYTQYSYPLLILTQIILFSAWLVFSDVKRSAVSHQPSAISHQRPFITFLLANLLTLLLYLPWINIAWVQVTSQPNIAQPLPLSESLALTLGWFSYGITFTFSSPSPSVWFFLLFGLILVSEKRLSTWKMLVPIVWVALSVLIFLKLGLNERYLRFLLPAQWAFALWLGRGAWVLWTLDVEAIRRARGIRPLIQTRITPEFRRFLIRLAAVVGMLSLAVSQWGGLEALYSAPQFQRADYRGIVQTVTTDSRPGDAIILDAPNQAEVFNYYYRGETPVFSLPTSDDDAQTLAEVRQIISDHPRIFAVFWGAAERDPNGIVEGTLNREAYPATDVWYGDVRLVRYATPVELTDLHESGARFGDSITLERYAVSGETLQAGDVLQVRLDWRTDAKLNKRYKVFLQLLNPEGTLAAQRDSEPGGGLALTTDWQPAATISDHHAVILPKDLTPDHYTLIVGLYDLNDPQARLPVGSQTYLTLTTITIAN